MSWREDLAVLRHRDVRLFVSARFVSLLGSSIAPIALVFAVLDVSDNAGAVGVVLAARSIPNVVFLLIGGVISDRLPRHLVLVVANTVSGLTQGLAAALVISGHAQIWSLAAIEAVNGVAAAFVMPALTGILPSVVDKSELPQANAVSGFARSVAMIGGGAVAGLIVGFTGPGVGLAVDAVTFLLGAVLLARLTIPRIERTAGTVLSDLRVGWSEFVSRQWVWVIVLAFCLLNVIFSACYRTLGPVIADDTFGRAGWGVASAFFGAGLIAGGILMIRVKPRYPLRDLRHRLGDRARPAHTPRQALPRLVVRHARIDHRRPGRPVDRRLRRGGRRRTRGRTVRRRPLHPHHRRDALRPVGLASPAPRRLEALIP